MINDIFGISNKKKEKLTEDQIREDLRLELLSKAQSYINKSKSLKNLEFMKLAKEFEFYEIALQMIDNSDLLSNTQIDWLFYGFDNDYYVDYVTHIIEQRYNSEIL